MSDLKPRRKFTGRTALVFISVFFTIRWAEKSVIPVYDVPLNIITIVIAILLNYSGPLKLNI